MIANRTLSRAEQLVEKLASNTPIDVYSLDELQTPLNQADIVISSTGSPTILITKAMAEIAEKARQFRPTLMVDIAVPRDIDENVSELESVYHYTVDDLQDIIQRNLSQREQASEQAQDIITQECNAFFEWLKVQQFSNLIRHYRDEAENYSKKRYTKFNKVRMLKKFCKN